MGEYYNPYDLEAASAASLGVEQATVAEGALAAKETGLNRIKRGIAAAVMFLPNQIRRDWQEVHRLLHERTVGETRSRALRDLTFEARLDWGRYLSNGLDSVVPQDKLSVSNLLPDLMEQLGGVVGEGSVAPEQIRQWEDQALKIFGGLKEAENPTAKELADITQVVLDLFRQIRPDQSHTEVVRLLQRLLDEDGVREGVRKKGEETITQVTRSIEEVQTEIAQYGLPNQISPQAQEEILAHLATVRALLAGEVGL